MDLPKMREYKSYPTLTDDRGFTYFLVQLSAIKWQVKKVGNGYDVTIYTLHRSRDSWTCDCPAGERGRNCKHKVWVGALADASIR